MEFEIYYKISLNYIKFGVALQVQGLILICDYYLYWDLHILRVPKQVYRFSGFLQPSKTCYCGTTYCTLFLGAHVCVCLLMYWFPIPLDFQG